MTKLLSITLDDFQRTLDELFDDILIDRWRPAETAGEFGRAMLRDCGDRYELQIAIGDASPSDVEVEVTERHLKVRIPNKALGFSEGAFSFSELVDRDGVTARASEGALAIVLPKKHKTHRVRVIRP